MAEDNTRMGERMQRTINGPQRPSMPRMSSFMVEDAEAEIRRSVQRHYEMQAENEQLKTDRDNWKNEALLFKADNERLLARIKDLEAHNETLNETITALETAFDNSAQIILGGYQKLKERRPRLVTPPVLQALEHSSEQEKNEHSPI